MFFQYREKFKIYVPDSDRRNGVGVSWCFTVKCFREAPLFETYVGLQKCQPAAFPAAVNPIVQNQSVTNRKRREKSRE